MMPTLTSLLSTPLAELRGFWLEERCCGGPMRSPLWFHAARWPDWLLSDLAMDHVCQRCGAMPALALLAQNQARLPSEDERMELADRFDEG